MFFQFVMVGMLQTVFLFFLVISEAAIRAGCWLISLTEKELESCQNFTRKQRLGLQKQTPEKPIQVVNEPDYSFLNYMLGLYN